MGPWSFFPGLQARLLGIVSIWGTRIGGGGNQQAVRKIDPCPGVGMTREWWAGTAPRDNGRQESLIKQIQGMKFMGPRRFKNRQEKQAMGRFRQRELGVISLGYLNPIWMAKAPARKINPFPFLEMQLSVFSLETRKAVNGWLSIKCPVSPSMT